MKYNDNGTIKSIVVKSGDTLPVGTIVDFDGTTVPDGYEEVEEENNVIEGNEWTMIKHSNGILEGFIKKNFIDIPITTVWGSLYRSDTLDLPTFPISFIEIPEVQYNTTAGATVFSLQYFSDGITINQCKGIIVVSPTSRNGSFTINCHVIGKWK